MFTKRIFLTLCALATLLPLVGCRHRCCSRDSSSFAPPPAACCPTPAPGGFLPPPGP